MIKKEHSPEPFEKQNPAQEIKEKKFKFSSHITGY
jgi:hypothetical protein